MSEFTVIEGDVTLRKSDGTELATPTDPLRVDPTGTTTQPTSNAAASQVDGHSATIGVTTDADTANTVIGRLKQIITRLAGGLPSALVGGRLDTNLGAWLGSTAPTVGQKTMADGVPVVVASDQSVIPVHGAVAHDAVDGGNPIKVGGKASSGIPTQVAAGDRVDAWLLRDGAQVVQPRESASFVVVASAIVLGNNKSMLSIAVTGSTYKVGLRKLYLRNVRTAAVTGVATTFELHRFTSHSGGTDLTPAALETVDALPGDVTVKTNATITGEVATLLERWLWSSDEWGPGTLDVEGNDHPAQNLLAAITGTDGAKPVYIPGGGGLHVKCATNTTAGEFDLVAIFTVEPA